MKNTAINLDAFKIDFSKVQQDQPGLWPLPLKVLTWIALIGLVVFMGNKFYLIDTKETLAQQVAQEATLKSEFEKKAFQAKNLEELREQMEVATKTLDALLKQLPSQTEVPGLLEDITKTGIGSGLQFNSIALQAERKVGFYAELPISIRVQGGYHDFATFASGVSALSRIVSLHEFTLTPQGTGGAMSMTITAKTYRADTVADTKPQNATVKSKK
jgi:type IV pilus assembly protein PilO